MIDTLIRFMYVKTIHKIFMFDLMLVLHHGLLYLYKNNLIH